MTIDAPLRYTAFSDTPSGGNPAGVVLDTTGMAVDAMQRSAAEIGYSETAFLRKRDDGDFDVRYFSPLAEVPFCGHATIASAVALAERQGAGTWRFHTKAGGVTVQTRAAQTGYSATLTSVAPYVEAANDALVAQALDALDWSADELDPALPPRIAYAGARHLVLAAATRDRLARLDYGFDVLKNLMLAFDLTTIDLVWRESAHVFHARNPFPVGGIVEDPATGAAAAAFGAYLRELKLVPIPSSILVHQGEDMGRPSLLTIDIDETPGIRVTGRAVAIPSE